MKKTIIIGISAGIASYKVLDLISSLKRYFNIELITTKNALEILPLKELKKTKCQVHHEMFIKGYTYKDYIKRHQNRHISLSDKAELILIAPATADVIGKIANGIADDLLTTTVMATKAPVIVAPSMNCKMWQNPIVQNNVSKLKKLGYHFIDPEFGMLACGYEGVGRLADIKKIDHELRSLLANKEILKGKKILVTAGATSEEIDPVRIISNKSSGKMGIYLAEEASKMGAKVTLIRGRTDIEPNNSMKDIKVTSVKDMLKAVKSHVKKTDMIIHSAAVSDFTVPRKGGKIKSDNKVHLELEPTTKILDRIKRWNPKVFLVGFKAEYRLSTKQLIDKACNKLKSSSSDIIVANDVGKTKVFGSENNDAYIIDKDKNIIRIKGNKRLIANKLLHILTKPF